MAIRKGTILAMVLAARVLGVRAEEVRVTASVDRQVLALGERLTLQVVVSGSQNASAPEFKELRGMRVVQGPATSTQMSIVNGEVSSSVTFTFVLAPTALGEQEIGPIEVRVGRQVYRTTPMKIVVSEGSQQKQSGGEAGAGQAVFLVLQADRTNVYVNEQMYMTVTLYYRDVQVANVSQPQVVLKGFDVHEEGYHQGDAVVNNMRYKFVRFPMVVFPLQAGRQEVGPVRMKVRVREPVASRQRGFFDDGFFGGGLLDEFFGRFQEVEHEIESNTMTVQVKALPEEGRPAGFAGAVGQYELRAGVEPKAVQAGTAVTLTAELAGTGNVNAVSVTLLTNTVELRVYDPESRREQRVEGTRMVGRRRYTQLVIPLSEKVHEIPAIEFVYFDPRQERYVELKGGPFAVEVTAVPEGSDVRIADYRPVKSGGGTVKVLAEDILGLKTQRSVWGTRRALDNVVCAAGLAVPPMVWIAAVVIARWRERMRTDAAWTRRVKAGGRLHKYMREARAAYRRHDHRKLCEAVSDALCHYIADQLHVNAPQVSAMTLPGLVEGTRVREETVRAIQGVLEECDFGRFGGGVFDAAEARALLQHAEEVAQRLQRELR